MVREVLKHMVFRSLDQRLPFPLPHKLIFPVQQQAWASTKVLPQGHPTLLPSLPIHLFQDPPSLRACLSFLDVMALARIAVFGDKAKNLALFIAPLKDSIDLSCGWKLWSGENCEEVFVEEETLHLVLPCWVVVRDKGCDSRIHFVL